MKKTNTSAINNLKELIFTRIFPVSREKVWNAWTHPEQLKRWWGPKNFTSPVCEIDLREGGKYLFSMRSPEGKDYWSTGNYKEVVPMQKLVMTDSFADEEGSVVSAAHYGLGEDFPQQLLITVMLEETEKDQTKLILKHAGVNHISLADLCDMHKGWNESLDKLEASLK